MIDTISFPTETTRLLLPGSAGSLELCIEYPKQVTQDPLVIICHPHPLHGGTLDNKVVYTLAKTCLSLGFRVIRFNFRGAGKSEGAFDQGVGECEDLLAIIHWSQLSLPNIPIALAGFSFGSYVVTRVASETPSCSWLVTIAPAVEHFSFQALPRPQCPWLVVQGDQDEIVSATAVADWAETVQPPVNLHWLPSAGHFFHQNLVALGDAVRQFLKTLEK